MSATLRHLLADVFALRVKTKLDLPFAHD